MITFYSMESCPHCQGAMVLLEEEISKGVVSVKPHTQAPPGVRGFPHFVMGNKTHTGAPKSKSALFQKLGINTESYYSLMQLHGYGGLGVEYYKGSDCGEANPYAAKTPWPVRDCATEPRLPGNCTLNTYGWWKAGVL